MVSINQICSIVSYSQKVFQNKLASEVLNGIEDQFGTGYTLLQASTTRITNTKIQNYPILHFLQLLRPSTGLISVVQERMPYLIELQVKASKTLYRYLNGKQESIAFLLF